MLVALALLMVAIAVVAFRDRQFLFDSEPVQQATLSSTATPSASEPAAPTSPIPQAQPATEKAMQAVTGASQAAKPTTQLSAVETVQHPLSKNKSLGAPSHSIAGKSASSVIAPATQRTRIANVTVQQPETTLYPRLDQRTKVEGSVDLQALVGKDGTIQEIHVVRGPAVLGSAAREAVLQWKFKPFTQNGIAVETYAHITVNFTIKVVDGSPKTVASVEPEHVIILADNYQR
jgi:protein TonB